MVTAAEGVATSTTWLNWIDTGTGALFDFDFAHTRPGNYTAYALSTESQLRFTVGPQDTTYAISGAYQVTDLGAPGLVSWITFLQREGFGVVMQDRSQSANTSNESFTVANSADGESNDNFGSLTGTLLAGQTYRFSFNSSIQAYPDVDSGANAIGCVTLSIGGATGAGSCGAPTAVPDPGVSTGSLLALAVVALAWAFYRR
jgi:hypothetical protein